LQRGRTHTKQIYPEIGSWKFRVLVESWWEVEGGDFLVHQQLQQHPLLVGMVSAAFTQLFLHFLVQLKQLLLHDVSFEKSNKNSF
jgi:hypothetical protein